MPRPRRRSAQRWRAIPGSPRPHKTWRRSIWRRSAPMPPNGSITIFSPRSRTTRRLFWGSRTLQIAEEKWSEATDLLNSARAAAAFDPTPGLKLMGLYESRRDWNSAKAVGAELFARFPRDVNVVAALGRTQLESGD